MSDAIERGDDSANNDLDLCDEDYPPGITCAKCGVRCSLEYYCSKDAGVQCFEHYCENCIDSHGCERDEASNGKRASACLAGDIQSGS